jgi:hypothetical protein
MLLCLYATLSICLFWKGQGMVWLKAPLILYHHIQSVCEDQSREHKSLLQCACIYHLLNIPAPTSTFHHHFLSILFLDITGTLPDILIARAMLFQLTVCTKMHTQTLAIWNVHFLGAFPSGHISIYRITTISVSLFVSPQPGWCTEKETLHFLSSITLTYSTLDLCGILSISQEVIGCVVQLFVSEMFMSETLPTFQHLKKSMWKSPWSQLYCEEYTAPEPSFCLLPDPALPVMDTLLTGSVENKNIYLLFYLSLGKKAEFWVHNPWVFSNMVCFLLGPMRADRRSNHPDWC